MTTDPHDGVDWRQFEPLELSPILTAALDAFYENGFHGATVRDIASRVGLTVPALYYHYENKAGLFAALLEIGTTEAAWRVRAAATEAAGHPDVQFVNAIEAIVLHMTCRTRLATLDSELRHLPPEYRKRYAARRKEVENVLVEIVLAGTRAGVFSPDHPIETARALLGMCQSVARWYQWDGPLGPSELAGRYVDIALMAVGAKQTSKRAPARRRKSR
ncbi:TetR/AcrR family transcriptional regulator [Mycobacterium intracellulare]|uniref:TetR/AcrR family transcriptional regulator n=1 Tax=Mycobacterium intracellulare TaxID=1767 RepID=UPI0003D1D685|nr:TetR/AcrR family transcriptional regulator [Mycobacterium intracellulare]ETB18001.1 TetR family transcriptional regulator [Mycobacterium avium 09-5983]OCB17795.1 TetR family transcriptional regulator [Mycobacterium intracellulare subsp. yongonense]